MLIQRIETIDDFARLAPEWNALLDSSAYRCVFLTHEWLFTWWKHLAEDRKLSIVTVRDGGALLGILPIASRPANLARMTPPVLEFLGSGVIGSDYLDVIVRPESEESVLLALGDWIHRQAMMMQLSQLHAGSCGVKRLGRILSSNGWTASERTINVCPYITFAGRTWQDYLSSRGSSHRYNFQRRLKKLSSSGFRFAQAATDGEVSAFLDILIRLHCERWTSRNEDSEAFQTDAVRAFHREFAGLAFTRDWLRLFTLWIEDRPIAALYGLQYKGTFSFYQSGFDPEYAKQSAGLVLMGLAIKTAIEDGAGEYDFLHGAEEYKYHWAEETRGLECLELYPPHAKARAYRHAIGLNRAARRLAHRVLQRL